MARSRNSYSTDTIFPHHISLTRPMPLPSQAPRSRRVPSRAILAIQGSICILVIAISTLALNAADSMASQKAQHAITVAVQITATQNTQTPQNILSPTPTITQYNAALLPDVQPPASVPHLNGQLIYVSVNKQWMWVFQNGTIVFETPVTTGRPELPTPLGTYHVLNKQSNLMFYSPWPPSSPFYYTPEHIIHALYFREGGFYIHDATWRKMFGPGSNVPHSDPDGTQETGSHGCVNVPPDASDWLYQWANLGATIVIAD
jgi:lipoprotein-anchoring transpeptidase ErfK/SrfK